MKLFTLCEEIFFIILLIHETLQYSSLLGWDSVLMCTPGTGNPPCGLSSCIMNGFDKFGKKQQHINSHMFNAPRFNSEKDVSLKFFLL
jgi:hypothetical protein